MIHYFFLKNFGIKLVKSFKYGINNNINNIYDNKRLIL